MSGTTLCPNCKTRFKIDEEQLETHAGLVRCGFCMQTFDARPGFIPDQPDPQLELPMMDLELPVLDTPVSPSVPTLPVLQPMTLADQVAIVEDENADERPPKPSSWPWAIAALLMTLLLAAQCAYIFRVDLAAWLPGLKPTLVSYCRLLNCTVPLPQNSDLIVIESSQLEVDPEHESRINLNALLRNRAQFVQAFPNLELTFNDSEDKPLARRIFKPADYLPPQIKETEGMLPNQELSLRLHLSTEGIRPIGYRLAVFYPGN